MPEQRRAHGLVFRSGEDLLLVYGMRIGLSRGDEAYADHDGLCPECQRGDEAAGIGEQMGPAVQNAHAEGLIRE